MNEEYAIRVNNVTKMYKLFEKNSDRVKDALGLSGKKKLYKDYYALKDVSFDIKKGETVGIIGVNGAGKSTILKIITGVLNPTAGNVEINGRISALLELGAGFNQEYTGEKFKAIAEAFGVDTEGMDAPAYRKAAIDAVRQLSIDVGIPTKLEKLKEEDLPFLCESAAADACAPGNPRPASLKQFEEMFRKLM